MRGKQDFPFMHLSERLPLLEKYARGTKHVCHVNPKDISEAVLEVSCPYHDSDAFDFSACLAGNGFRHFGFFLILFGIGTALKAFAPIRRFLLKRKRIMASAFFILAVAWPIFKTGVDGIVCTYREVKTTNYYVKVPAKVLYSSLLTHPIRFGKVHLADIGYEYEVGGRKYEGDRVAIIYNSSSYYKLHRGIVDSFRPGGKREVFVSPDDPRKSVLIRSNIGDRYTRMGAFALLGIYLLIIGVKKFVKAIL
jgi:hypothetical protein